MKHENKNGAYCTYDELLASFPGEWFPYSEKELVQLGYPARSALRFDHQYRWLRTDVARWFRGKYGDVQSETCAAFEKALGVESPARAKPQGRK